MVYSMRMLLKDADPPLYSQMLYPEESISYGSSKRVWWKCMEGHQWEAKISNRTLLGQQCPYCSGRNAIKGINDLEVVCPDLFSQLKDKTLVLKEASSKKVSWICEKGHEWEAVVSSRTKGGSGCPFCSGHKALKGINDLSITHPELWEELVDKSLVLLPGSGIKVKWKCSANHEYETSCGKRTSRKQGCPYCAGRRVSVGENDLATTHPELFKELVDKTIEVTHGSSKRVSWSCSTSGHLWTTSVSQRTNSKSGCPDCNMTQFNSKAEENISDWLTSLNINFERNNRKLVGMELDFWIPEHNLAIEHNGLRWHSEWNVGKNYHYLKWNKCKDSNIQLIQIWEDQWRDKRPIVKSKLLSLLGLESTETIGARNTSLTKLSYTEAKNFLDETHIQGGVSGSVYLGLVFEDALVAVAVFKTTEREHLLLRYSSSLRIIGGLDKLLKACGPGKYVTFADHCISDGGLYEKTGWVKEEEIRPDYKYTRGGHYTREHKFKYRLKKFKSDPKLEYVEGMTENQLAKLNRLDRIWDAGKTRYVKYL